MPTLADYLARCPRCHKTALLVYGEASYRNLALFDAVPWSPLDELEPDGLTEAARKRWQAQLPYKLYICYIDFERGTWQIAVARASEKLRRGLPLWKPHNCLMEANDVEPKKKDVLPDLPAAKIEVYAAAEAGGESRRAVENGRDRPRRARFGRYRDGGV